MKVSLLKAILAMYRFTQMKISLLKELLAMYVYQTSALMNTVKRKRRRVYMKAIVNLNRVVKKIMLSVLLGCSSCFMQNPRW